MQTDLVIWTKNKGVGSFANISVGTSPVPQLNEIDDYLHLPVENVTDPLLWWFNNRRIYLHLLHMTRDYLSVPHKLKQSTYYALLNYFVPSNIYCS